MPSLSPVEVSTPAVGFVKTKTVRLTAADMNAANIAAGLGFVIVPAAGPDTVIMPVGLWCVTVEIFAQAFTLSPAWSLNYRGIGGFGAGTLNLSGVTPVLNAVNQTRYCSAAITGLNATKSGTDLENKAIVITGNLAGVSGGLGSIMYTSVSYVVMPVGV